MKEVKQSQCEDFTKYGSCKHIKPMNTDDKNFKGTVKIEKQLEWENRFNKHFAPLVAGMPDTTKEVKDFVSDVLASLHSKLLEKSVRGRLDNNSGDTWDVVEVEDINTVFEEFGVR